MGDQMQSKCLALEGPVHWTWADECHGVVKQVLGLGGIVQVAANRSHLSRCPNEKEWKLTGDEVVHQVWMQVGEDHL